MQNHHSAGSIPILGGWRTPRPRPLQGGRGRCAVRRAARCGRVGRPGRARSSPAPERPRGCRSDATADPTADRRPPRPAGGTAACRPRSGGSTRPWTTSTSPPGRMRRLPVHRRPCGGRGGRSWGSTATTGRTSCVHIRIPPCTDADHRRARADVTAPEFYSVSSTPGRDHCPRASSLRLIRGASTTDQVVLTRPNTDCEAAA